MLPLFIFLIIRPPPRSNLFPYTTLFRSAVYPGATAQDVATAVAAPIEQQLSGLDGLLYLDRKSTRLNSSHRTISYAVFCLKKKIDPYVEVLKECMNTDYRLWYSNVIWMV